MSLETASFIKALNANNPEGTDPKSQGDDHLRMIKAVLLSQFSGLTQGKAIRLTEDMINNFGGVATSVGLVNMDDPPPYHQIVGHTPGDGGTFPPGAVLGDIILHMTYDGGTWCQYWFCVNTAMVWTRRKYGVVGAWTCLTPLGVGQTWQELAFQRAFNTTYTNTTGRPIQVNVSAASSSTTGALLTMYINGVITGQATSQNQFSAVVVTGLVLAGQQYNLATSVAMTCAAWSELR